MAHLDNHAKLLMQYHNLLKHATLNSLLHSTTPAPFDLFSFHTFQNPFCSAYISRSNVEIYTS